MKKAALIRHLIEPLKHTPFHPQWFIFRKERISRTEIGKQAHGLVLDIGSGREMIKNYLSDECKYVSLDYYQTATQWYGTRPQIFSDGQNLPIKSGSTDTILMLDVLEHLPEPELCIKEIWRVLRPGGKLILQVPFLYPLHDSPYDYHRWTFHGLQTLAHRHGFSIDNDKAVGHPLESSALLMNLALSKTVLNWKKKRNPLFLLAPLLLFIIPGINIWAWLITMLSSSDDFMPYGYCMVWIKQV